MECLNILKLLVTIIYNLTRIEEILVKCIIVHWLFCPVLIVEVRGLRWIYLKTIGNIYHIKIYGVYEKWTDVCILFQVRGAILRRLHPHFMVECFDMVVLNVLNTSHVETTFRLTLPIFMVMHEDLSPALSVAN